MITLIVFYTAKAQVVREIDWLDFEKSIQKTTIAEPVPSGKFTIFRIININKFLNKVEIKGKAFELETPVPAELETLFKLKKPDLEKTANNKKADEGAAEVKKQSELMRIESDNANSITPPANFFDPAASSSNKSEFASTMKKLAAKCDEYAEKAKELSQLLFRVKAARVKLIGISQMETAPTEIMGMANDVDAPVESLKDAYTEYRALYEEVEGVYEQAKAKAKTAVVATEQNNIKEASEGVEKGHKLIEDEAILSLMGDVDFLLKELNNKNNYIVVAPPVQMQGDIVTYKVDVTPVSTRSLSAHKNPVNFNFDVPARGGLKVDFSVGPTISFGNHAKDQRFFFRETTKTDTSVLERRENNNSISPGIAAMMHVCTRLPKNVAIGGMFGVGAGFQTVSDANLSLYFGGTIVLGKSQKVMLSGGLSFLKLDRLKTQQFSEGTEYDIKKVKIEEVTEKVLQQSFFFSISYNISNRKEIN